MLEFRFDVGDALERAGFTAYEVKRSGLIGQSAYQRIKAGDMGLTLKTLNTICMILDMQPKDILVYKEKEEDRKNLEKLKKRS